MTCDLTLPLSILAAYLSCSPPQWLKYRIPRCFGTSGLDSSKVHRHTETADFPGLGRKMSKVHFCFQVIGNSNRIPRAQHRQGNRIATQFKNGFGKPSNMAFSGFQRLSAAFSFQNSWVLSLHVIACHCNHVRVSQTSAVTVAMSLVGNAGNTLLVALVPCQFWMMRCIWDRSLEEIQMAALSTEAITMPEAMRRSFDSTPNSKNLVRSSEKVYEDGINRINRINPMHLSSDV